MEFKTRLDEIKYLHDEANEVYNRARQTGSCSDEDRVRDILSELFCEEHTDWLIGQAKKVEQYKKEIMELRGKAHLSCPNCHEDCVGWIVDGKPCGDDW